MGVLLSTSTIHVVSWLFDFDVNHGRAASIQGASVQKRLVHVVLPMGHRQLLNNRRNLTLDTSANIDRLKLTTWNKSK